MSAFHRLLALETAGPVGSVALAENGRVLARRFLEETRTHASSIIPAIHDVLEEAGCARSELTAVAVGAGPGSFTGVRVAAATGKGIAHALGIPLYVPSSLEGAVLTERAASEEPELLRTDRVRSSPPPIGLRVVLFDARGTRLFAAAYRLGTGQPEVVMAPAFRTVAEVAEDPRFMSASFCGDGAVRHRQALSEAGGDVLPPPNGFPSADGLVRALSLNPQARPVADPFGWEPNYLRETGAVRARRGAGDD